MGQKLIGKVAVITAGGEEGTHNPLPLAGALEARAGQVVGKALDARIECDHGCSNMKMTFNILAHATGACRDCQARIRTACGRERGCADTQTFLRLTDC